MVDPIETVEKKFKKYFFHFGTVTKIDPLTGALDVDGSVFLRPQIKVKKLPVIFENITGEFNCANNQLITLTGAPHSVQGSFVCRGNKLTSLQGAPSYVGLDFTCERNPLKELTHAPEHVGGKFLVDYAPHLPLLRTLMAQEGAEVFNAPAELEKILSNPLFQGKGKSGALRAAIHMIQAGYRENAKW